MNINITKDQVYERKADRQGRISLPSKQFAEKKIEIIVSEVIDSESKL